MARHKVDASKVLDIIFFVLFIILTPCPGTADTPGRFYLTIERSFSTTESPSLRLDFTDADTPILIRVLKPESLEGFLDGQLQISRSYEEPRAAINPGHYFLNGLNQVKSPLRSLRGMISPSFRTNFAGNACKNPLVSGFSEDLASEPPEIVHQPPLHFSTVREFYVDLQLGGQKASDFWWWFKDAGWSSSSYHVREIAFSKLPEGIYLVQGVQGDVEGQALLQVSSLGMQVKQSSSQLLVRVMDRESNPVKNAEISMRDGRGKWQVLPEKTNASGELLYQNPEGVLDGKLVVRARTGDGHVALASTDFLPSSFEHTDVFLMTDRPIFKPGETFSYKGTIRRMENGELKIPEQITKAGAASLKAKISLANSNGGDEKEVGEVPLSDFASFSGSIDVKDDQAPGLYQVKAKVLEEPYIGELRIRDYVKPTFYLEFANKEGQLRPGQKFTFKIQAHRYSGGVPQGLKYEIFVYKKKFEAPQFISDAGLGLSAGTDYYAESRSAASLIQPQRIFSSVDKRSETSSDPWSSAHQFDENGMATDTVDLSGVPSDKDESIYTLMIKAMDRSGAQAVLSENFYLTLSEAVASAVFLKTIAGVGDKGIELKIRSTKPEGEAYPASKGFAELSLEDSKGKINKLPRLDFKTDKNGNVKLTVPAQPQPGRLRATVSLVGVEGRNFEHIARSDEVLILIGNEDGSAITANTELELYTQSTVLSPGEKAKIYALLPVGWGNKEAGLLWLTTAAQKIFSARAIDVKGRSHVIEVEAKPEYGTGFYETVTLGTGIGKYREQSLGFRVIPWDKRLNIKVLPSASIAEPLKPFVLEAELSDAKGAPVAGAEVALGVVDRAVYAVQPEFRPGIFDFFYPLPRLNLMSFYSDELQGYGYSDVIRKPNFKLTAIKNQSKPAKKTMRDTAGWYPHLVTDERGRVKVDVDMPANLTEWLVTAVAIDKAGRLGEGTAKFRSGTDIGLEARVPQFMREGDSADFALQLSNQSEGTVHAALKTSVKNGLEGATAQGNFEFEIASHKEHLETVTAKAVAAQGDGELVCEVSAKENVKVGGAQVFDVSLKDAALTQVLFGKNAKEASNVVSLDIPKTGNGISLDVHVVEGFLAAALSAANTLVSYPYGCTEQLSHTTIPNLVLIDLLKKLGFSENDMGQYKALYEKAKQNATYGVKKLAQNQKSDGGFSLWPEDSESTVPATLVAMEALDIASKLEMEGAEGMLSRTRNWLGDKGENESSEDEAGLSAFELTGFADLHLYNQPIDEQVNLVKECLTEAGPGVEKLSAALLITKAHGEKTWDRFNTDLADKDAKAKLSEKLKAALATVNLSLLKVEDFPKEDFGFVERSVSLVSRALRALGKERAASMENFAKIKGFILDSQVGGSWGSTFDNAMVILDLKEFIESEAAEYKDKSKQEGELPKVTLADGTELGELIAYPGGYGGHFEVRGIDVAKLAKLDISEVRSNARSTATLKINVPVKEVKALSHGLSVKRSLYRINGKKPETLSNFKSLKLGDVIVTKLSINRGRENPGALAALPRRNANPSEWVVVQDPIPSIAEAIEEEKPYLSDAGFTPDTETYWKSVKETLRYPEKTVRVVHLAPGFDATFYNVWRVGFTGSAIIPPAEAFDMYDEALRGNDLAYEVVAVR